MSLKTKYLLRGFCKYVYYSGCGNFWYEDIYKETVMYRIFNVVSYGAYTTLVLLENLATLFGNFPAVETKSAIMLAGAHNIVLFKLYLLVYHKGSIRKLNLDMGSLGESLEEETVMKKQYRKVKWGCLFFSVTVFLTLLSYGLASARRALTEGKLFMSCY